MREGGEAFRCRLFTLSQRTLLPPAAQADAAKVQLASRRPTGLAAARPNASAADSHDGNNSGPVWAWPWAAHQLLGPAPVQLAHCGEQCDSTVTALGTAVVPALHVRHPPPPRSRWLLPWPTTAVPPVPGSCCDSAASSSRRVC